MADDGVQGPGGAGQVRHDLLSAAEEYTVRERCEEGDSTADRLCNNLSSAQMVGPGRVNSDSTIESDASVWQYSKTVIVV